ncbi:MAG: amidohydrolase [Proteobacteria bacterium]|nr:amidohydrolase [Pseudomonadota bacterium]
MIKNKFLLAFVILSSNALFLESSNLVIKNAEIYDGIENNSYQGHILINDGVISKISKTTVPYAEQVYDAKGKIITPGFIAPDTQLGIVEIGALSVTRDDEASIYSIGFSIHDAFNPNSVLIPWNRANGITSAITLPRNTSSPIGGLGSFFLLDSNLDISSEADIVMIGRFGGSGSSSRAETLALIDDILSFASSLDKKDMSSDSSIDEAIDDSSLASHMDFKLRDVKALYRLINSNLPLIIKTHRASDIIKLIELKNTYNLNLIIMGAQEASLVAFDELASNINMTPILEKAGATLMFNVSRSHNYHLIRQGAGVAVANGMSYDGAIKALTSNVAKTFNLNDRGSIKVGNIADIVVWEADPLEPSSMPEKVFINGVDTDLTTRSTRLRDRYIRDLEKPNTYRN